MEEKTTPEELLQELAAAFEEYIDAVDSARRQYHDSTLWYLDGLDHRIDRAEMRLWAVKEDMKKLSPPPSLSRAPEY
jgi:hypothetical protein